MKNVLLLALTGFLFLGCNSDQDIRKSLKFQGEELKQNHRVIGLLPDGRELHYTAVTYMTKGDDRWHHIYYVDGSVSLNYTRSTGKTVIPEVQVFLSEDEKVLWEKLNKKILEIKK